MDTIVSSILPDHTIHLLLQKLEDYLPYSIPLTRRIQFHLRHPSNTAQVFVALSSPSTNGISQIIQNQDERIETWLCNGNSDDHGLSNRDSNHRNKQEWIAAHIDLFNPGQTQVWVFASWEVPSHSLTSSSSSPTNRPSSIQRHLTRTLFTHLHRNQVPTLPSTPSDEWHELKRTGKYLSTPYRRSKVLFGSVNDVLNPHFEVDINSESAHTTDNEKPEMGKGQLKAITRRDGGYSKYIFPPAPPPQSSSPSTSKHDNLPEGYEFISPLPDSILQTVLDRTPIPRTLRTLKQLVSVGVVYHHSPSTSINTVNNDNDNEEKGEIISWGFLGKDASLSSLHTEPDHRGKGLALALAQRLLALQAEYFSSVGPGGQETRDGEDGKERQEVYGHADVSISNQGSRRVMEKLDGKVMWEVVWVEVDLDVLLGEETRTV